MTKSALAARLLAATVLPATAQPGPTPQEQMACRGGASVLTCWDSWLAADRAGGADGSALALAVGASARTGGATMAPNAMAAIAEGALRHAG